MVPLRILVSFALISTGASTECPSGSSEKTRLTGTAYKRLDLETAEDCCAHCSDDQPACAGWVFYVDKSSCVLKNETQHEVADDTCISGSAGPPTPSPQPSPTPTPSPAPTPTPSPPKPVVAPLLDTMFQGGAVLQRDVAVAVWGTSQDSKVQLQLRLPEGNQAVEMAVPVNASGIWLTYLPPQAAGYGYELEVSDSQDMTTVGISFGEVVLCAGQSNMGMQVGPSERAFDADNATAEAAAAGRYTGKIMLHARTSRYVNATMWYDVTPESITTFSAVCWYAGRDLWFHMSEKIPVGLIMNAVGAHPIEHWLGPDQISACLPASQPLCKDNMPNSLGWGKSIVPMQPFTIGTMLWDQGEQNINCDEVADYPCLTRQLVRSYREQFNSSFPFISVQLPGYAVGPQLSYEPSEQFAMRLAQDAGSESLKDADTIPTYDYSCAMGKEDGCPHGNVHNVHKQPIGARLALQIRRMRLGEDLNSQGPRVSSATLARKAGTLYGIQMEFEGTNSLHMGPTRNCTTCCDDSVGDFDVSVDGVTWLNTSAAVVKDGAVQVEVDMLTAAAPRVLRYTANRVYPQCAVFGVEGIPAMPFQMNLSSLKYGDALLV